MLPLDHLKRRSQIVQDCHEKILTSLKGHFGHRSYLACASGPRLLASRPITLDALALQLVERTGKARSLKSQDGLDL
jgi:hypothetical protein